MSEAPKRIWGVFDQYGHGSTMLREIQQCRNPMYGGPEPTAYIRADLVEAAIKRALEEVAKQLDAWGTTRAANSVRAIDPAQFIEEPKG